MMATYSFLITGEMALEAAEIFNHSIATTRGQLITDDGISFSSYDSLNDVATTSSSQENDADTVDLYIFIVVMAVVVAVLLIVMVAVTIVM